MDALNLKPTREAETEEYKRSWQEKECLDALAALANTRGGVLWVGVQDNGSVAGWHGDGSLRPFPFCVCGGDFVAHNQFRELASFRRGGSGCGCGFDVSLIRVPRRQRQSHTEGRVMKDARDRRERATVVEAADAVTEAHPLIIGEKARVELAFDLRLPGLR